MTATGFSGSGASLTSLTAGNLTGTIPSAVLGNSTVYIGTTAIALNRASASQTLTGTSIDGNAGTATTATTATNATNTATTDDTSTNATVYPVWKTNTTGNLPEYTSSTKLKFNPSTGVLTSVGTVISSDKRLKRNIVSIDKTLDKVMLLNPVTYNRLDNDNNEIGFIAQEVQKIIPEVVDDSGEYLGIAYANLVPVLVKAIQEQQKMIEKMAGKLAAFGL